MDDFLLFALVGFLAQLVDGALGMAYGVVSSTVLIASGVPPATASASVHAAEIFTTAASATAHIVNRNVDWRLLRRLAAAGIVGGLVGTYILTGTDGGTMRVYVMGYLAFMGFYILTRSVYPFPRKAVRGAIVVPVGAVGGFADAVGGGGWGPVVTSSLIGAGGEARSVIGSVNTAEFFVTVAVSAGFLAAALTGHWEDAGSVTGQATAIGGLIVGGVLAAPLAGYAVRVLPRRVLTAGVGALILGLSLSQLLPLL